MVANRLRNIGKASYYPLQDRLDKNTWPARELLWVWCHPILSLVLIATALGTIFLYVTGD